VRVSRSRTTPHQLFDTRKGYRRHTAGGRWMNYYVQVQAWYNANDVEYTYV
jgi:hypothetical protein